MGSEPLEGYFNPILERKRPTTESGREALSRKKDSTAITNSMIRDTDAFTIKEERQ
jgi:hypothetical protein